MLNRRNTNSTRACLSSLNSMQVSEKSKKLGNLVLQKSRSDCDCCIALYLPKWTMEGNIENRAAASFVSGQNEGTRVMTVMKRLGLLSFWRSTTCATDLIALCDAGASPAPSQAQGRSSSKRRKSGCNAIPGLFAAIHRLTQLCFYHHADLKIKTAHVVYQGNPHPALKV